MVDHRLGEDERCRILTAAEDEMGATAATFVHVCVTTRAWHAVALYKDQNIVHKQAPLYFRLLRFARAPNPPLKKEERTPLC